MVDEFDEATFAEARSRLGRLRQQRGWSLDDLARQANIDRSLLAQIESGRPRRSGRTPAIRGDLTTWQALAHALNTQLTELLPTAIAAPVRAAEPTSGTTVHAGPVSVRPRVGPSA